MRRIALPLLAVLNTALLCFLAWVWVTPDGQLRDMRWQPPQPLKVDLQALLPALPGQGQADTSQFLGMLERPLFSPTRRPPPPPPPPKAEVPEPVNRFAQAKLTGVFEGVGVGGIIINYEGKDRRVPLNGMLDGWTLQSVAGGQATFSQRGQTRVVSLQRAALATYTGVPQNRAPAAPPSAVSGGRNAPSSAAAAQATPEAAAATNAAAAPPRRPSFGGR
ncbi:MAG: hypothetical protein Q8N13_20360 [Acidovorax sp.]|nr:hypothetical protein [Acidovorax sp.]